MKRPTKADEKVLLESLAEVEKLRAELLRKVYECYKAADALQWSLWGHEAIGIVDAALLFAHEQDNKTGRQMVRRECAQVRRLMDKGVFTVLIDPTSKKRKLRKLEVLDWVSRRDSKVIGGWVRGKAGKP
jgi:KaiC/GvpD/RAD55 family RecA-like ATPase